jgi:hypothetical protein
VDVLTSAPLGRGLLVKRGTLLKSEYSATS